MFLKIDKTNLLSLVTDYDIYSYYIPDTDLTKLMISPLRPDEKTPSFKLFKGVTGEICFNDFTLRLKGDVIKFVQKYYEQKGIILNFGQTLTQIVIDLGLEKNYLDVGIPKINKNENVFIKKNEIPNFQEIESKKINVKIRIWKKHDIEYWAQYGISIETLKKYNVLPISLFYIDGEMYVAEKLAYCYVEKIENEIVYKIYQPHSKKMKWLGSFTEKVIQGYRQLPDKGDFLIITKSLKDVMSLKETANINAIAFNSENYIPDTHIIEDLKKRFKNIVILYDNDFEKKENHGIKFASLLSKKINIPYIYFDEKYGVKDYSDAFLCYDENAKLILYETLVNSEND